MVEKSGNFRESISILRARIDTIISSVQSCVDVVGRINELSDQRNRAQNALNGLVQSRPPQGADSQERHIEWIQQLKQITHQIAASEKERDSFFGNLLDIPNPPVAERHQWQGICSDIEKRRVAQIEQLTRQIRAWNKEITRLHSPFQPVDAEARGFIQELRDVLDMVPLRPRELRDIRSEIERLPLWTNAYKAGPLGMQGAYADLLKMKRRMDDLLACLPERGSTNSGYRQPSGLLAVGRSPAALIASWCKTRRESQRALAGKAGISPNTLKKIMDGKTVRSAKIAAVAEVLGCRYEDLLP